MFEQFICESIRRMLVSTQLRSALFAVHDTIQNIIRSKLHSGQVYHDAVTEAFKSLLIDKAEEVVSIFGASFDDATWCDDEHESKSMEAAKQGTCASLSS